MKQRLTRDFIVIDTNVFGHLLHKDINSDNHIDCLLWSLLEDNIKLLLDNEGEIHREYSHHLVPLIKRSSENSSVRIILTFYMAKENHVMMPVDCVCELMQSIDGIIVEEETIDKIFVYLALSQQRILVTNDRRHIVNRRGELLNIVESDAYQNGAKIHTSQCAYEKMMISN